MRPAATLLLAAALLFVQAAGPAAAAPPRQSPHLVAAGNGRRLLRTPSAAASAEPDECRAGLWVLAKQAPDLSVLVAVQHLTPLNFFTPFGKASQRAFTLLAPTDAAWARLFGSSRSESELRDLQDGFAALLLYHQVLARGYSADQMAQKFSVLSALGPALNKELLVDMDRYGDGFIASGRAPQNHASLVREHEVCGAHMLVIDEVLLPFAKISTLPHLAPDPLVNQTVWQTLLEVISPRPPSSPTTGGTGAGAGGARNGTGAALGAPPAQHAQQEALDGPLGIQEGDQDEGEEGGVALPPAPPTPPAPPPAPPAPPSPPGILPDCAALAGAGQLITVNGTLAGCGTTVAASVSDDGGGDTQTTIHSGSTQTVVSDAGQVPRTSLPPPTPAPSGGLPSGRASAAPWAALVATATAAAWLLAC